MKVSWLSVGLRTNGAVAEDEESELPDGLHSGSVPYKIIRTAPKS